MKSDQNLETPKKNITTTKKIFIYLGKNIFGIIGIAFTFFMGYFIVPKAYNQFLNERYNRAENEAIQSLKEIIYNDSLVTYNDIKFISEAKRIELNNEFNLTDYQLLIKAQESFIEDRFLPYEKKAHLNKRIDSIKQKIPNKIDQSRPEKKVDKVVLFSRIFTVLLIIVGIISFIISFIKKEKDQETLQQDFDDAKDEISNIDLKEIEESLVETKTADEIYEEQLKRPIEDSAEEILEDVDESLNEEMENERGDIKSRTYPFSTNEIWNVIVKYNFPHMYHYPLDNYLDFKFYYLGKNFYVKLKPLLVSKVGLGTINTMKTHLTNERGEAWLIYKTGLTILAIKAVAKFNALHEDIKIIPIKVGSVKEFENILTARLALQKK